MGLIDRSIDHSQGNEFGPVWPSGATADVTKPFRLSDLSNREIPEPMSGNLYRCAC